jgi:hypothetical protein
MDDTDYVLFPWLIDSTCIDKIQLGRTVNLFPHFFPSDA